MSATENDSREAEKPPGSSRVRTRERDEASLYETFNRRLVRKVSSRVKASPEIVEDACAFAWSQFMRYQPSRDRAWRSWLITHRGAGSLAAPGIDAGHRPLEFKKETGEWLAYEPADPHVDRAEQHAEAHEALSVLATVSERRRHAKELQVAGLNYDEIARALGISPPGSTIS